MANTMLRGVFYPIAYCSSQIKSKNQEWNFMIKAVRNLAGKYPTGNKEENREETRKSKAWNRPTCNKRYQWEGRNRVYNKSFVMPRVLWYPNLLPPVHGKCRVECGWQPCVAQLESFRWFKPAEVIIYIARCSFSGYVIKNIITWFISLMQVLL